MFIYDIKDSPPPVASFSIISFFHGDRVPGSYSGFPLNLLHNVSLLLSSGSLIRVADTLVEACKYNRCVCLAGIKIFNPTGGWQAASFK